MSNDQISTLGLSRRRLLKLTGGTVAAAGVTSAATGATAADQRLVFDDPARLNPPGKYGYEPSVVVDEYGTIYATAHKSSVTNEGTRLSSWFWYSTDGGETWQDMPSAAQVDNKQYALEGDIAIDGQDRVYYVDTYAAENHLNRWLAEPSGPVWDYSKPAQQTTAVDDRPWLQAHGDGIVYYLGNNGLGVPAPNDDPGGTSRIWFYRSSDGGLTWTPGFGLPTTGYCSIAADKSAPVDADLSTKPIHVATDDGGRLELYHSTNAGQDWTFEGKDEPIYEYQYGSNDPFPVWSATDRAGNPYHFTVDDDPADDTAGRLLFVRGAPGAWDILDIADEAPGVNTFTKPWIDGGSEGFAALTFYGSPDTGAGDKTWHTYALVTPDAQAPEPDWYFEQVTDAPVSETDEPEDFFECAVGLDDSVHITYGRNLDYPPGTVFNPTRTYNNNLFHVRGRLVAEDTDDGDRPGQGNAPVDAS